MPTLAEFAVRGQCGLVLGARNRSQMPTIAGFPLRGQCGLVFAVNRPIRDRCDQSCVAF